MPPPNPLLRTEQLIAGDLHSPDLQRNLNAELTSERANFSTPEAYNKYLLQLAGHEAGPEGDPRVVQMLNDFILHNPDPAVAALLPDAKSREALEQAAAQQAAQLNPPTPPSGAGS